MSNVLGSTPPVFNAGVRGLVPPPTSEDVAANRVLAANGSWVDTVNGAAYPALVTPRNIGSYNVPEGCNAAFIHDVTASGTIVVPDGSTLVIIP